MNNLLIQLEFYQIFHWPDQISTGICPRARANFAAWYDKEKEIKISGDFLYRDKKKGINTGKLFLTCDK